MTKKVFFLFAAAMMAVNVMAGTVVYTADNTTIFRNPERGFTDELGGETMLSDTRNHLLVGDAEDWYFDEDGDRESQTLVVMVYYLGNYRTRDLTQQILQGFADDMQVLRNKGFKCVLRFAYDWNSKTDASLTWTLRHIAQLKPYLAANADVIYVLQTGFVGQWGEWYYSTNHGNETQHMNSNRRQVLSAMLDACPSDRFLLVRYPMIKTEYLGDANPLTEAQAYSSQTRARIGHHNDAFLNDYGDNGTYASDDEDDDPQMRQYIADETLFVPNGGETNVEKSSRAKKMYTQAETQMSTYHWSFCGSTYAEAMTNLWRTKQSQGDYIFNNMNRQLGYRFQLVEGTYPDQAQAGETIAVAITLRNVGYAPIYNERPAYLVLSNPQSTFSLRLASDPRTWRPNGDTTRINETLTLPADMPAGTYQLSLHLPDKYASLAQDPRFAVRFANTGVWDAQTGRNDLQATLVVTRHGQGTEDLYENCPPRKLIRDGQVVIERGNSRFTVTGQRIR